MRSVAALSGGVVGMMLSGIAAAQGLNTDDQAVMLNGNVSQLCILGTPSVSSINLGELIQTSGLQVGRLATIGTQNVQMPASFCNYAGTRLTVTAAALVAADTSAVQAGFARAVNYTATVTSWAATPAAVTTTANASGANPSSSGLGGVLAEPKQTDLSLALSGFTAPGNGLLIAGAYSGSVTVTVGPDLGGAH